MSRAPHKHSRPTPPTWNVTIAEHAVSRWRIEGTVERVLAWSGEAACLDAVRRVHIRLGLPPWKPYVRLSLEYATVEPLRLREAA
jgi:hypothetical protein